jgi:hypothetical protein
MIETKAETPKATAPTDGNSPGVEPTTKPKRRGRPFSKTSASSPLPETPVGADATGAPEDQAPRQQRKRKSTVDVGALAKNLRGIHALAAKMIPIKGPDGKMLLELDDTEATQLADAVAGVAKEYDLELSGKTGSAIQLLGVVAMIYGPRIYVIQQMRMYMQQQNEMKAQAAAQAARAADESIVSNIPAGVNGHQPAAN